MKLSSPISVGELLDKISILQIKASKTDNSYVHKELKDLTTIAQANDVLREDYIGLLFEVNSKLWDVEDSLRQFEKRQEFTNEFIELARSVYITNDKRAAIKKEINNWYNSEYSEVKLYSSTLDFNAQSNPAAPSS